MLNQGQSGFKYLKRWSDKILLLLNVNFMAAILFICLVNNKNNAFLYYYKIKCWIKGKVVLNIWNGDQIKFYCKIFKSKPFRVI